ncbi:MAG: beta-galactosidase [Anaerolineales bacterium]|nr:beta-galactosidase [Anaerolineales bacterium]
MLHGADYNPDQWPPDIWLEDMRLMKLAHCNTMAVGIFAWTALEPEEGHFTFDWLDRVMDLLADNGMYAVLATPSGARPTWLSSRYPEVLRVRSDQGRNLHGGRHNHCPTSPVYRGKTRLINTRLAERYKDHPALLVWHVSNEYSGECFCNLCCAAFRDWLKRQYDSLDALNHAWWTTFWNRTYTDWGQIDPPSPVGETSVHGLSLDWKRFMTDQTLDFMQNEMVPLRQFTPDVPVTTNFMGFFPGVNYWKLAPALDVISWDSYPLWHQETPDTEHAVRTAFAHDLNRSMKQGQPFMLMESTPSVTNWHPHAKLKRPGMHLLSSLQAVAHGSDTVQYFQWRKSRGSSEKFHGAVVDHAGHEHTRVFRDVSQVGQALTRLDAVIGTTVRPQVALIYDWENRWALDEAQGLARGDKGYWDTCLDHYHAFWKQGFPVDVIDMEQNLAGYSLVVAPMLYMVKPGVAERFSAFVEAGGTLVLTYWSGIVDKNDLCFQGGFPGPLRQLAGIWAEEIDALAPGDENSIVLADGNPLGLSGEYAAFDLCDLIHAKSAAVLATYKTDFYAGRPALTVNTAGLGEVYYMAARHDRRFLVDFYRALGARLNMRPILETDLPEAISVHKRSGDGQDFVFVMNFSPDPVEVQLDRQTYTDIMLGERAPDRLALEPYGVRVLVRELRS